MGNSWFQFREFRIEQGRSAMKVCSDSCLFAALVAKEEAGYCPEKILDPGCGTGLLSLMLAQEIPQAKITGIESDAGSAMDCRLNFRNSQWADRLQLIEADIHQMATDQLYDLIICNPPFFLAHLPSLKKERMIAMHNSHTDFSSWISFLAASIKENGRIHLLLSEDSATKIHNIAEKNGLRIQKITHLLRAPQKVWRVKICLEKNRPSEPLDIEILVVQEENGEFAPFAKGLLAQFYREV